MRVRKDWNMLRAAEKNLYVEAVNDLKQSGVYDLLVQTHANLDNKEVSERSERRAKRGEGKKTKMGESPNRQKLHSMEEVSDSQILNTAASSAKRSFCSKRLFRDGPDQGAWHFIGGTNIILNSLARSAQYAHGTSGFLPVRTRKESEMEMERETTTYTLF